MIKVIIITVIFYILLSIISRMKFLWTFIGIVVLVFLVYNLYQIGTNPEKIAFQEQLSKSTIVIDCQSHNFYVDMYENGNYERQKSDYLIDDISVERLNDFGTITINNPAHKEFKSKTFKKGEITFENINFYRINDESNHAKMWLDTDSSDDNMYN
jgi:hypothetical protein